MTKDLKSKKIPRSRDIAYTAVMCALLIGGQYVFSFVAGVEIVTLLFTCFSYVFGVKRGAVCAVAFSLLRCIFFPFSPTSLILDLIYYPALTAVFGGLGHIKESTFESFPAYFAILVNVLLIGICTSFSVLYILDVIELTEIYKVTVNVLLWVVFGLSAAGLIIFDVLFILSRCGKASTELLKVIMITSVAAVCTICFTLSDDIITPLFYGLDSPSALSYFYGSFVAMLPQIVCTIVTVSTLFLPLNAVLKKAAAL